MAHHGVHGRSGGDGGSHPCDPWSRLRLAGLVPSLISNLLRRRGERVQVVFDCAGTPYEAKGTLADAGLGFVILVSGGMATMVPLDRLCSVKWVAHEEPQAPGRRVPEGEVH